MNCTEIEEKIVLAAYGELPATERQALEEHLRTCTACQAQAQTSRALGALLDGRAASEISPELLVRSRLRLEEALDAEQMGWRRLLADWFPLLPGAHASRAVVTIVLLVVGFGLGWLLRPRAGKLPAIESPSVQTASLVGSGFGRISSISQVLPDPETHQVRITLNAEHHVTLEGSLDDPRIRRILVDAVKSYDNAGIRLDTVNALKQQSDNPSVQDALLYALERDPNAGVRLEALKSVREMDWSPKVEAALIHSARSDKNPGVRVAAIDALVSRAISQRDESLLPVFQGFAENDPCNYVRLEALAAVHELEANQ